MRKYNADPKHDKKVEFFGIDVTDPMPALENIHAYLEKVDFGSADHFKNRMEKFEFLHTKIRSERELTEKYVSFSDEQVDSLGVFLTGFYDDFKNNRSAYISKSSKNEFEWMLQQMKSVLVAHDIYRMRRPSAERTALSREDGMTNNIRWLLGRDNRRIVLWAHNMHIARSAIYLSGYRQNEPEEVELFGTHIGNELGDDLYSIGFSFYQADYKDLKSSEDDMLGAVFSMVGPEMFFLDVRAIPKRSPVFNWFNQKHRMRVGAFGDGAVISFNPVKAYDAIIFTHTITETELSPVSRKRRSNWNVQ
jgi:erythromycin esterase